MHRFAYARRHGGFVVLVNTLIFIALSLFVTYAIAAPLIASDRATGELLASKRAFMVANSAMEETLYKMKAGMTVGASETLTLAGTTAEVTVSNTMNGRIVNVSAEDGEVVRALRVEVTETTGVSFNYGIQVGRGGFHMTGGGQVHGNVYANGPITGGGGAFITGSATAANGSDPALVASNGGGTPPLDIAFGGQVVWNDKKPNDLAQSFTVSTTTPITSARLFIRKYANEWMADAVVRITNSTSGHPGKTTLASGVLSASQVTTSYNHLTIPFSSTPSLTPGTTYWLVIDASNDQWNSYFQSGANDAGYANGTVQVGTWSSGGQGGTWANATPASADAFFDLYAGGESGLISGLSVGSAGGDAWAHEVKNSTVGGTIYCQASQNNNKACDTSRPDPVQQPYPISDGNIADWKQEAEAGGVHAGNLAVGPWPNQTMTRGPQKIEGNLTVNSGGTLTVAGTLWITGNLTLSGGGTIRLDPTYGDATGVIVVDGRISANGGGSFQDNGLNYILIITTSTCPDGPGCSGKAAIEASGGSDAVIYNAQNGTIEVTGGAYLNQATAETLVISGGSEVHYETGMADMNFSSGPSGSWGVETWDEI